MNATTYATFLTEKAVSAPPSGFHVRPDALSPYLFPFQRDIVLWAVSRGKAAIFCGTGLGKTAMQLEWSRHVTAETGMPVLILAPLAVAQQTAREGERFGIAVTLCRDAADVREGINITNYERLHRFDVSRFAGIVLDESSLLKSYDGATTTALIESFAQTPYKLACTATPAPNDYMELGNHAEFLGVMSRVEMLAMFFVHDGGSTQDWRLKGHAQETFWQWLASWGVMMRLPSDLGYDDGGFALPPLRYEHHTVASTTIQSGMLFAVEATDLMARKAARRDSIAERVAKVVSIVNASHGYGESPCGNQSTPSAAERSISPTPQIANGGATSRARRKKTAPTCANTILPTPSDTENKTPQQSSSGTDSMPNNSPQCSRHKVGAARFADQPHDLIAGSILTTITSPGQSGDCSVTPAINDSAEPTTTPNDSARQDMGMPPTTSSDTPDPWVIWVELNAEQDALAAAFGDRAISIYGSLDADEKTARMMAWLDGARPILISKPSICGFGLNMQRSRNVAFVGLSDSWEQYYQAIRRCYRFGQKQEVRCHIISSEAEGAVVANIERKERDAEHMAQEMVKHMQVQNKAELAGFTRQRDAYAASTQTGDGWTMHLGDCVEAVGALPDNSIDFSVFSPPFASLYTYSNSERDMGNCKTHGEFYEHFGFLVRELFRVLKSGRLVSFHCMNLPTTKTRDGFIGIADFRGDLIRMFQAAGFIFHSEVVIWKDPVTAMQRTKAIGLLYKQLKKDSNLSRQGIPDFLVTMRKPGVNPEPITKDPAEFPVLLWQNYASPVWMDINPSETLQKESAREEKDERHIAPLQLEVIRRAVKLWTNPGDLVLSPFAGIGSEGFVSIQEGRRFVGAELKASYYKQACANLQRAASAKKAGMLFDVDALGTTDTAAD